MDSYEILNKLSSKSVGLLKAINPKYKSISTVQLGPVLDMIAKSDERFSSVIISLDLDKNSKVKVDFFEWIIASFYEALLINSETVDINHLFFALLLKSDIESYYLAKKQYYSNLESKLEKEANVYIENISGSKNIADFNLVGREKELTRLLVNLTSDPITPILLLGDTGIGKTSLIYELAKRINRGQVPLELLGAKIFRVKFPSLLNLIPSDQSVFPSDYFSRLLMSMLEKEKIKGRIILFIDDLKLGVNFFIGLGGSTNDKMVSLVAAAQNDIQEKFWESPLAKSWNVISMEDQAASDYKEILVFEAEKIYSQSGVKFDISAIDKILELYKLGVINDAFPGNGIKLLNSLVVYKTHTLIDYKKVSNLIDKLSLKPNTDVIKENLKKIIPHEIVVLDADVSSYIGNDESQDLDENSYREKFQNIEEHLKKEIIGQEEAIDYLSRALRVAALKLHMETKPLGSFLLLGPTGVGKTETAKAIAKHLFGTRDKNGRIPKNFLRIDMTEFSEKHSVAKLFGAPPGYVGYEDNTSLADFVKENPHCLVLFDEIDKANPDVLNSLLHIMDEAEIRANNGEFVSFENVVIMMTSNHGAELIEKKHIGFDDKNTDQIQKVKDVLINNLKKILKPELLNRFDEIIVYKKLGEETLDQIIELILEPLEKSMTERNIKLTVLSSAIKLIGKKANYNEYGARDLKRTVKREITDLIAKKLLAKSKKAITKIKVKGVGDKIEVEVE
jgi:ATP-dependent Clp protease ATP-binding subunit ClpC